MFSTWYWCLVLTLSWLRQTFLCWYNKDKPPLSLPLIFRSPPTQSAVIRRIQRHRIYSRNNQPDRSRRTDLRNSQCWQYGRDSSPACKVGKSAPSARKINLRWIKEWICSERPITICAIVKTWLSEPRLSVKSLGDKDQWGLLYCLYY